MTSTELENLSRLGKLKRGPATQAEFDGLLRSGRRRLAQRNSWRQSAALHMVANTIATVVAIIFDHG